MELKNVSLAGKKLVTSHGVLEFGTDGVMLNASLPKEAIEAYAKLKGFELREEAPTKPTEATKKTKDKEVAEETKAAVDGAEKPTEEKKKGKGSRKKKED